MGQRSEHVCDTCGYRATVSGGPDTGMVSVTQTVACAACGELFDVTSAELRPSDQLDAGGASQSPPIDPDAADGLNGLFREVPLICPRDPAHPVTPWGAPGPCPRADCPGTVHPDPTSDTIVLWD